MNYDITPEQVRIITLTLFSIFFIIAFISICFRLVELFKLDRRKSMENLTTKESNEFNETANVAIVIQREMANCKTVEELNHTLDSWEELIKNMYLRRMEEM